MDANATTQHVSGTTVRTAWRALGDDPEVALRGVLEEVAGPEVAITFLFYSHELANSLISTCVGGVEHNGLVVGCSSSGVIVPEGFQASGAAALSLSGAGVKATARLMSPLSELSLEAFDNLPHDLSRDLGLELDALVPGRHVFITLFDGLSGQEDMITAYLGRKVAKVGLVGGSAGDDLQMLSTTVLCEGVSTSDAVVVVLLEVPSSMALLNGHHYHPTGQWLRATNVDRTGRLVSHLDGRPALERLSELVGLPPDEINVNTATNFPFASRFKGQWMLCGIMGVTPEGTLRMARGVEPEQRFMLMEAGALVEGTQSEIERVVAELGHPPQGLLLFHCLGRTLMAKSMDVIPEVFDALNTTGAPVLGLNTYGEQFGTLHVNYTLTGIAF